MKQINFSKWAVVMTFFLSSLSFAQVELKGRVINENDQTIPGAKITIEGTTSTVDANNEGVFVIKSQVNEGALVVTKKGFVMAKVKFAATNALLDLGTIVLIAQSTSIDLAMTFD